MVPTSAHVIAADAEERHGAVADHGSDRRARAPSTAHRNASKHGWGPRSVGTFTSYAHFFATTLLGGGANVEAVRRLLGHRDLASTTRYVHATGPDMVRAIAALPGNCGETAVAKRPHPAAGQLRGNRGSKAAALEGPEVSRRDKRRAERTSRDEAAGGRDRAPSFPRTTATGQRGPAHERGRS
jgi:hypothetical protein